MQRLGKRLHQVVDGLLPLGKIALGLGMQGLKRRLGEAEERFVVLLERFARECLERVGQLVTRLCE